MRLLLGTALLALAAADTAYSQIVVRQPGRTWERIGSSEWYRAPDPDTGVEAGRAVDQENEDWRALPSDQPPALPVGADVLARNGSLLGVIVGVVRAEATGDWYGVIRDEGGELRAIDADAVRSGPDGALSTDLTEYQFRRLRSVVQGG